jgi:hypothetical protein
VSQGAFNGFSLGIQDGFFRCDDDFGFHSEPGFGREKMSKHGGETSTATRVYF